MSQDRRRALFCKGKSMLVNLGESAGHLATNQGVGRSNRSGRAIYNKGLQRCRPSSLVAL